VIGSTSKILTLIFLFFIIAVSLQSEENNRVMVDKYFDEEIDKTYDLLEVYPDSAANKINDFINKHSNDLSRLEKTLLNIQLGYCYQVKKEYEIALEYFYEAKSTTDIDKYAKIRADVLRYLGDTYRYSENYKLAENNYFAALKLARSKELYGSINWIYQSLGRLQYDQGDYSNAIFYYLEAYKLFDKQNDEVNKSLTLINIADIYHKNLDLDSALVYFEEACNISHKSGQMTHYLACLNNISNVYADMEEFELARVTILRNIDIEKDLKGSLPINIAKSYNTLGTIYEEMDSLDLALQYYEMAYTENIEKGNQRSLCVNLINIGHIYALQQNINKAITYYDKALLVNDEDDIDEIKNNVYKYLSELHGASGNYKKAFHFQNLYAQYQDSLFNEDDRKNIASHFKNFDLDKSNDEKVQILTTKEKTELELRNQKTKTLYLYFGLTSLLAVTFFFFAKYKLRDKDKQKLQKNSVKLEKVVASLESEKHTREVEQNKMQSEIDDIRETMVEQKDFNKFRVHLLSIISNEFKQTLGDALIGMENMKRGLPYQTTFSMMDLEKKIKQSIFNIMKMIDNASLIYKDFDDIQLRITEVDLFKMIDDISANIVQLSKFRRRIEIQNHCISTFVKSDYKSLELLFSGIFAYSIKNSMKEQPVKVDIYDTETDLIIKIEDSSYGMSKDEKELILQPIIEWNSPYLANIKDRLSLILANQCSTLLRGSVLIKGEMVVGNIFEVSIPKDYYQATFGGKNFLKDDQQLS
jgi:tetratricopeptide (TPR) repeat protein